VETERPALSVMLETCVRALEAARAQQPPLPAHILVAMEETCTDLRARLAELSAELS
jgi:hypothetical protein